MKQTLVATGLIFALLAGAAKAEQTMLARVTVYWARGGSGSDKWTRNHQAATRVRLRSGHCAVDPRRIPYGSKITLPDGILTAVDTGKHVRTRRAARLSGRSTAERNAIVVDRFFETKKEALRWARTHPQFMLVRVNRPNDRLDVASRAVIAGKTWSPAQTSTSYVRGMGNVQAVRPATPKPTRSTGARNGLPAVRQAIAPPRCAKIVLPVD